MALLEAPSSIFLLLYFYDIKWRHEELVHLVVRVTPFWVIVNLQSFKQNYRVKFYI